MAAPNIISPTTITGNTAVLAITTTATAILTNSAASGKALKVDQLLITNVNGSANTTVNVELYRSTTSYYLAYLMTVPAGATLDIISSRIYLQEGDSLRLTAGLNSYLQGICSYEDIS